ncbi:unnamed protein product [Sphenostylis stenocarpa]|uniref:Uncharacterized protein n=1 Tax=Sphenostylis stenocarpa TaxID=92480 RepID=A0AA86SY34_9FABA|nr:unnamed protein product [Sphenostylis stenocarpa]
MKLLSAPLDSCVLGLVGYSINSVREVIDLLDGLVEIGQNEANAPSGRNMPRGGLENKSISKIERAGISLGLPNVVYVPGEKESLSFLPHLYLIQLEFSHKRLDSPIRILYFPWSFTCPVW